MATAKLVAPNGTAAALASGVIERLEQFRGAKRAEADHPAVVEAAKDFLAGLPTTLAAAAANPAALARLRQQRTEAEQCIAEAAAIATGLAEATRVAGLEWSTAWTQWKDLLQAEMVPDFAAQRRALDEREAAARAAFEAKLSEMPAE
jgi:hypothetical protein